MTDMVFRMAGDPPINFKAVDNGDGTYSLAVHGAGGGGVSYITDVSDTATVQLSVDDGALTATVVGGNFAAEDHGHGQGEITGLTSALNNKADAADLAAKADVSALDAKADAADLAAKADDSDLTAHVNDSAAHTNTTYSAMSAAEAEAGTATTQRTITAAVLADEIDRRVAAAIAEIG